MDRLRTVIDPSSAAWLLGTRGPIEYAETMNMPGTADVYLYPKEQIAVPHVDVFCSNKGMCTPENPGTEYSSLFDFRMSMMIRLRRRPMNIKGIMSSNMRDVLTRINNDNRRDYDGPTTSSRP